jgi:hypothetical protein
MGFKKQHRPEDELPKDPKELKKQLPAKRKNPRKREYFTEEQVLHVCRCMRGNVAKTERYLGYKPGSLRARMEKNPGLKEEMFKIREECVDEAEDLLWKHIVEKESLQALLEYLKSVGQNRGYGGRKVDLDIKGKVEHGPDPEALEALTQLLEDRLLEEAETIDIEEEDSEEE